MNEISKPKRLCRALAVALPIAGASACAHLSQPQDGATADDAFARRSAVITLRGNYPPGEAGVRRAAAQGPEALRRYIWRTRMIYNYYYPDYVERR